MNTRFESFCHENNIKFSWLQSINGVDVYTSTQILTSCGVVLSAAMMLDTKETIIILDDDWKKIPKIVQSFMIAHEFGHIKKKHLERAIESGANLEERYQDRFEEACSGKVPKEEAEADLIAAQEIGKRRAIRALKWLYKQQRPINIVGATECKNRAKLLKKTA